VRGAKEFVQSDMVAQVRGGNRPGRSSSKSGANLAMTPGKSCSNRNDLIGKLDQYTPNNRTRAAEPILIGLHGFMKYYILDLSLRRILWSLSFFFLVGAGFYVVHVVFVEETPHADRPRSGHGGLRQNWCDGGDDCGGGDYRRRQKTATLRLLPWGNGCCRLPAAAMGDATRMNRSCLCQSASPHRSDFTKAWPLRLFINDSGT